MVLDFELINRELAPKLMRKATAMCSNNHTFAEEAVQETLTSAWKNQAQFTGGNVHAWLTTILRNKIIDAKRPSRAKSFLHHSIQMDEDGTMKEGFKALTFMPVDPDKPDVQAIVKKAIESLPQEYVNICKLRLLEGKEQKEVAALTGMPLGTVQSRMFRIMKTLRDRVLLAMAR
jgi:RNA polymerase sigma-70 factor (ECF subfamily)